MNKRHSCRVSLFVLLLLLSPALIAYAKPEPSVWSTNTYTDSSILKKETLTQYSLATTTTHYEFYTREAQEFGPLPPLLLGNGDPTFYNQGWDFGQGDPVYGGYIDADNALYSEAVGYGWNDSVTDLNRGVGDGGPFDLIFEDFEYDSTPSNFTIHVTYSGEYNVTVWAGDVGWCLDTQVYMEGVWQFDLEGDGLAGLWLYNSSTVEVTDGYLNIGLKDKGTEGDGNWRGNGILIAYLGGITTTISHTTCVTSTYCTTVCSTDSHYQTSHTTESTTTSNATSATYTGYSTTTDGISVSIDVTITYSYGGTESVDVSEFLKPPFRGVAGILLLLFVSIPALAVIYWSRRRRR